MTSLADESIQEAEEREMASQPSSSKTELFCDYNPIDNPVASTDGNSHFAYVWDEQEFDEIPDDVDSSTYIPDPVEAFPLAPMPVQPPSPVGRDAAALGAPSFNRARNSPAGPPPSDWASLLFEDGPGDLSSPRNGAAVKSAVEDSPVGRHQTGFLTESEVFADEEPPTLEEQMTSVARTLGITLGLELELAGDDYIRFQGAKLPNGYPEGTATLFVKEVFVAGAAYESKQVEPGDFITALSSVPIAKVTIEFLSKKIRDFVGVPARQSALDTSVQIPEIDGLPLHLGILRLTGDKLYPDNALIFRAMLLKRLQAQLHEQEATAYRPTPEPELPPLPGHSLGFAGHNASPPDHLPLQPLRTSPAPLGEVPRQFGAPGFTTSGSPGLTSHERKVIAGSPVRSSPMVTRGISPHLLSPSWTESPSGTAAIDRWLPSTPSSALNSSALNSSQIERQRLSQGLPSATSPFSIPDVRKPSAVPLKQLGKMIDEELAAAMKQLEAVEGDIEEM